MIKTAGCGVAMANACEELKKIADIVTKSNDEDGVAYILEKYSPAQKVISMLRLYFFDIYLEKVFSNITFFQQTSL